MNLSEFLVAHREPIMKEWVSFARSCTPASGGMDLEALRDHASEMLSAIAEDLATTQTSREQSEKSKGHADDLDPGLDTAAEEHGAVRAESGLSVEQMVAEFRALRASVLRLWTEEKGVLGPADVEDLTRFNEAIDQALAESVTRYSQDLDQAKEVFLAILGHDLRTPLGAIYTSADFLVETQDLQEPALTLVARMARSASRTVTRRHVNRPTPTAIIACLVPLRKGTVAGPRVASREKQLLVPLPSGTSRPTGDQELGISGT